MADSIFGRLAGANKIDRCCDLILNIHGPHGCGCLRCAEDESFVVALHLHYTVLDEWSVCLLTTKHPKSLPQIEIESACAPRDQAAIPL